MPSGFVQLIYRTTHEDGARLVAHPLMGGCGYTGGRGAGLVLKEAADRAGKPIYLELSSINPVVILPGALEERSDDIVGEFVGSCLMGTGQFCTNPGLVVMLAGDATEKFIADVTAKFESSPVGTLLGGGVEHSLAEGIIKLQAAGAELLTGGEAGGGTGYCVRNTLLRTTGADFLANAEKMQTEAFGNSSLMVVAESEAQLKQIIRDLEGNLTGCVYSHTQGKDDAVYNHVAPLLRQKVGRLLNDKMPTGVAVSPAMNHGGPFPATGHATFTSVGIPASIHRFAMLHCYDAVRPNRLPDVLKNENPIENCWRSIDGRWTTDSIPG